MTIGNPDHEEMRDLLAAYALDAVDEAEREVVEDHLRECPRCRSELVAHRETAALMARAGGEAPVGVWERIAESLSGPKVPPPLSVRVGARRPGSLLSRWPRTASVVSALVGAAAAAVIGVMAVNLADQSHRLDRLNASLADQSLLRQATAAALDPRAARVALTSRSGRTEAVAAVLPDGTGFLVAAGLPSLPASRTYELWSIVDGQPVADGLLGAVPGVTHFPAPARTSALAITDEPAGGSRRPTGTPVASGEL